MRRVRLPVLGVLGRQRGVVEGGTGNQQARVSGKSAPGPAPSPSHPWTKSTTGTGVVTPEGSTWTLFFQVSVTSPAEAGAAQASSRRKRRAPISRGSRGRRRIPNRVFGYVMLSVLMTSLL
jgi:hypothetical protein